MARPVEPPSEAANSEDEREAQLFWEGVDNGFFSTDADVKEDRRH